jgi:hypothetical protein
MKIIKEKMNHLLNSIFKKLMLYFYNRLNYKLIYFFCILSICSSCLDFINKELTDKEKIIGKWKLISSTEDSELQYYNYKRDYEIYTFYNDGTLDIKHKGQWFDDVHEYSCDSKYTFGSKHDEIFLIYSDCLGKYREKSIKFQGDTLTLGICSEKSEDIVSQYIRIKD